MPLERIQKQTELKNAKKEAQVDQMSAETVLNELKDKRLPTYGTAAERRDRLKKYYGIQPKAKSTGMSGNTHSMVELPGGHSIGAARKITTTDKIDQIKLNRDARRLRMEEARKLKSEREANNEIQGIKVDVDF
jgi:kinesin family member 2/24